jgi:hypothetical protein
MWTTALLVAAALAARSAEPGPIPRAKVANTEKLVSTQLASMVPDEPWFLLGLARGVYLDGTGVVFQADINLATGPSLSPFKTSITKEEVARHREKKEGRLPLLRTRMYLIMGVIASSLESLPSNEEYVLAVTLLKYPWEDTPDMPTQIVMRVPRGKFMEAQRQNAKPESVIKVREY